MSRIALVGLIAVALGACKPMEPTRPKVLQPERPGVLESEPKAPLEVGAVEATVQLEATLAERSQAANVTAEEMVNARSVLDLTTITVSAPTPPDLWVKFKVKCNQDFPETPVVMRAKVLMEGKEVDSFARILADNVRDTEEHTMDVMAKVTDPPESLLLYAQAELLLLPEGTDPASVDPATASAPGERRGSVISNPVRINFVREGKP